MSDNIDDTLKTLAKELGIDKLVSNKEKVWAVVRLNTGYTYRSRNRYGDLRSRNEKIVVEQYPLTNDGRLQAQYRADILSRDTAINHFVEERFKEERV